MSSICIFGVFVADLCFFGNKIPERGETVLGNNHLVGPGGKGSNQAIAAARLDGIVNFITKVGKDNHADMAFSLYKEAGVNVESISQDSNLPTGVAGIMIDENGNNAINIFAGAAAHLQNEDIDVQIKMVRESKSEDKKDKNLVNSPISDFQKQRSEERKLRMKEFNYKFRNSASKIDEIEKQPAYKRMGIDLADTSQESGTQLSRTTVNLDDDDGLDLRTNNSFLHDNVD